MDIQHPSNNNNSELVSPATTNPSSSLDYEKRNSLSVLGTPTTGRSKFFGTSPDICKLFWWSKVFALRKRYLVSGRVTPLEMQLHFGLERSLSSNGGGYMYPMFDAPMSSDGNGNGFRGSSPQDRLVLWLYIYVFGGGWNCLGKTRIQIGEIFTDLTERESEGLIKAVKKLEVLSVFEQCCSFSKWSTPANACKNSLPKNLRFHCIRNRLHFNDSGIDSRLIFTAQNS